MSDWKRMRTCNWAVLRLLRCSHNCMPLNPQPGRGSWHLWGQSALGLVGCRSATAMGWRSLFEWNQGLGSLSAFCRIRRSWEGRSGWRLAAEAPEGWSIQPPSIEPLCLSPSLCRPGCVDVTFALGSGGESFLETPREFILINCCFGILLPLFPLVSYNLMQNWWELRRLSNHLLNKHLCAESHMRYYCHQSIWAAGRVLPACPWEPWERQQLESCVQEMVFSLEAQLWAVWNNAVFSGDISSLEEAAGNVPSGWRRSAFFVLAFLP